MLKKFKKVFSRKMVLILGILVLSSFLFMLSSCSYDMSSVTFADETVTYDGESHSIEITGTLPEEVSVSYTGNDQTEVGIYTITATFETDSSWDSWYDSLPSLTATLTIKEASMTDISFESETFTYDGEYHTIEATGITDTTRYTVSYSNNSQKDAGEYNALAIVVDTEGTYETEYLTATLTIEKETSYDISFEDVYAVYDGETHSITATNLPTGVVATYSYGDDGEVDGETEVGTYTVTATFTDEFGNYNLEAMTATLYIQNSTLSDATFEDETVTYDGESHSITVAGLPDNVTASYTYNGEEVDSDFTGETEAGTYEIVASFTVENDLYVVEDMYATLTIEQADTISDYVNFDDLFFNIDTNSDTTTATMTYTLVNSSVSLPEGVEATYSDNATQSETGTYEVSVTFTDTNGNYSDLTLTANMTVLHDETETEYYTLTNLNSNSLTATISAYTGTETDITIPSYVIDSSGVAYRVTAVAAETFNAETVTTNANIESIVFNDYITSIGEKCCYECTSLTTVTLPNNSEFTEIADYCFYKCILSSLDLPSSVDIIGEYVFYYNQFTVVDLSNVNSIGEYAFYYCKQLTTLDLSNDLTLIPNSCFCGTVLLSTVNSDEVGVCNIPSNIETISEFGFGSSVFTNSVLTKLVTNDNLTEIDRYAFSYCIGLTSITLNEGLTTIGDSAFKGYSISSSNTVRELSIPSTVTSIGNYCFKNNTSLTTLTFEGSGTSVGAYAFYNDTALTSVTTVDNESTNEVTIGKKAFSSDNDATDPMQLETVVLSDNTTSIGEYAFYNDQELSTITTTSYSSSISSTDTNYMPEALEIIEQYAFSNCDSLDSSIYFYDNLNRIEQYAFSECSSLDEVYFGGDEYNSIASTTIEYKAFYGCNDLTTAKLYGVSYLKTYSFYQCSSLYDVYFNTQIKLIGLNAFYGSDLGKMVIYTTNGENVVDETYFYIYSDSELISTSDLITVDYLLEGYMARKD